MEVKKEAAVGVVRWFEGGDELILLVKKVDGKSLLSNKWGLVGETWELRDEDLEETIVRGIYEETGVRSRVVGELGEFVIPKGAPVKWFLCDAETFDLTPGDDAVGARWIDGKMVKEECSIQGQEL